MSDDSNSANERIMLAFNERYWTDVAADGAKPLAHYLEAFPAHKELIAAEYAAPGELDPVDSNASSWRSVALS